MTFDGMELRDVISFGKYKGKTLENICEGDPEYIMWLRRENVVELDSKVQEYAREIIFSREDDYDEYVGVCLVDIGNLF